MKRNVLIVTFISIASASFAQMEKLSLQTNASTACKCIDSVSTSNKKKEEVSAQINNCIDKQVMAYQLISKLQNSMTDIQVQSTDKKKVDILITTDKQSNEYKKYYYEIERYLMDSCSAIKYKISSVDIESKSSFSKNEEALTKYYQAVKESKADDLKNAILHYEEALAIDPNFAFAWDNLGICYRKTGQYEKALNAYNKSLEIDPTGMTPLQNIPVVYQYMKEYRKAIDAYNKLAKVDANNPEVFYGLGIVYSNLEDHENSLKSLCQAYNIYVKQNSPYRTDCEKVISQVYQGMKKQNKEELFYKILKENGINAQ